MGNELRIFTIGFTKKSARQFFTLLEKARVLRVIDVRLNNVSQLAGFAKREDLQFFLERFGIGYEHMPLLSPTQQMLDAHKKSGGSWAEYERAFLVLMSRRKIEKVLKRESLRGACLLCSEHTADQCHRRLVAEYLAEKWGGISVTHLM